MRRLIGGQRERGAVAILVALTLAILVAFVGVGVDLASAYAKTQEVQNAADAAAFAIAQDCAADPTCTVRESGPNTSLAMEMAEGNVRLERDTLRTSTTIDIGGRSVEVVVGGEHRNFFLGPFFETFTVQERAEVSWFTPMSGPATMPMAISACSFYTQLGEPKPEDEVVLWLSKGKSTFEGNNCLQKYPPGGFGWLPADGECKTYVDMPEGLVVSDTGANRPSCVTETVLKRDEVFLLPIFDDYATTGKGQGGKYQLSRFAAMKLKGYYFQEGGPSIADDWGGTCKNEPMPSPSSEYRKSCLRAQFVAWVGLDSAYGGNGPASNVTVIRLAE